MRMLSVKIFAFLEPKINSQMELWVMQAAGFDKNACDGSAASIFNSSSFFFKSHSRQKSVTLRWRKKQQVSQSELLFHLQSPASVRLIWVR